MKSQLSIAGNVYTMIYLYCNKEVELMFVPYFFQTLFVFTFECQEERQHVIRLHFFKNMHRGCNALFI